ncbi:hypothetical protein ACFY0P_51510 [Streptomyces sp. NPDC001714]|uniref:hypothetical protein n=1 Tax=Streptomyces sp. NPDC001714 TaxID=3364603 RepID=UPI0036829BFB
MGRAARASWEETREEPGLAGPAEAGRAFAVFGQGEQEPVQRWRDVDGVGAEGQPDALPGLDDVAGGEARDLGEGLAVEEDEQADDAVDALCGREVRRFLPAAS